MYIYVKLDKGYSFRPHIVKVRVFTNIDLFFWIRPAQVTDYSIERVPKDT